VSVYGYGFPKEKGGLMYEADRIGIGSISETLDRLMREDPVVWKPSAAIREVQRSNLTLTEYFDALH